MKKLLLLAVVFSLGFSAFAQNATKKAEDVVKFQEVKFNFGKIKQGVPVTHDFNLQILGPSHLLLKQLLRHVDVLLLHGQSSLS